MNGALPFSELLEFSNRRRNTFYSFLIPRAQNRYIAMQLLTSNSVKSLAAVPRWSNLSALAVKLFCGS